MIKTFGAILERGQQEGASRDDVNAVDMHMLISAFCFFRVSNRHTFGALFERDLAASGLRERHKALIEDAVLRTLEPSTATEATRGALP